MDFKDLKLDASLLGEYVNFVVTFSTNPKEALEEHLGSSPPADGKGPHNKVHAKLVAFSLIGVLTAMIIARAGAAVGMTPDPSWFSQILDRNHMNYAMPFGALIALVLVTFLAHGIIRLTSTVRTLALSAEPFRGSVQSSMNAALGLASWYLPLMTLATVGLRVAAFRTPVPPFVAILVVAPVALLFWSHFSFAFATVHRMRVGEAVATWGFAICLCLFMAKWFN
jgi:hypothetical protein